jgi:hypothetical protein
LLKISAEPAHRNGPTILTSQLPGKTRSKSKTATVLPTEIAVAPPTIKIPFCRGFKASLLPQLVFAAEVLGGAISSGKETGQTGKQVGREQEAGDYRED